MWLDPAIAAQMAAALLLIVVALRLTRPKSFNGFISFARESAIVLALYSLWQYVHEKAITKVAGATDNALSVWHLEQRLHLPSELSIEKALINHRLVMQFLNIYYAGVHVPAAGVMLLWLFLRHRDRYDSIRNALALLIAGCLLIQMIPVSPPRLMPQLGFIDAGLVLHQSVYGGGGSGVSNQLAAMPSLHVGWALLVGWAVIMISSSRYRWWVLIHPVLTMLAVTATANHWWLDGVVAGMILGGILLTQRALAPVYQRLKAHFAPLEVPGLISEPEGASL